MCMMPGEPWDITSLSGIREAPEHEMKLGGMMWDEELLENAYEQQK